MTILHPVLHVVQLVQAAQITNKMGQLVWVELSPSLCSVLL